VREGRSSPFPNSRPRPAVTARGNSAPHSPLYIPPWHPVRWTTLQMATQASQQPATQARLHNLSQSLHKGCGRPELIHTSSMHPNQKTKPSPGCSFLQKITYFMTTFATSHILDNLLPQADCPCSLSASPSQSDPRCFAATQHALLQYY